MEKWGLKRKVMTVVMLVLTTLIACKDDDDKGDGLTLVAESDQQWTGVAVSQENRVFANYPNWSESHTISVVEVTDPDNFVTYPNESWNSYSAGQNPAEHFIAVQSVYVDNDNYLWVLDPANPQRNGDYLGVVPGGAKLVKIDLATNSVVQTIVFTSDAVEPNSYLNDVRIDEDRQIAYITDSNEGAIVVVDLETGTARRVLENDPSTKSENRIIKVGGQEFRTSEGEYPQIDADGIALSPGRGMLYWRPLTGESLYRIETAILNNPEATESEISEAVEDLGNFPPSDGMIFGRDEKLYLTSVEENGIRVFNQENSTTKIKSSGNLKWPDSFAVGSDGFLYVTTSQLHIPNPTEPYRIYKFKP